ncbi:putative transcription factor AP2-EREBP family [Helianthus annuus]|uniref:Putative DNA-binding domain, Myb/SANT-like domain protein n=2 Tax=Helianthus annuus TaxID=4232 RepID=A0A251RZW7_HELAN|nr:uncharacterized protein LOC110915679 isoform X1 [Helianthus annuus]XP_022016101.1 uncharacterized protein LOC110915679 isoform X1 [Helianthus annuus]KAF5759753.1 putative transcription factor AP2-EREBP family [Helianthus annuus]KAJ0437896.1 putative transcription factor AP2-EREBP family [Helianthus annuus]KAJ0442472.1 putative transcription factor AP2-EREBP family [Helianthus annuus]KAJ0460221.1 putative transcription factor AP2-EREBP family [Helianthus annuus]KAJ0640660.1 putative transcr
MGSTPEEAVDLNKTECEEEEEEEVKIKYKGVRQRKSGKFVAEIGDPHKRRNIWLGTFDSPIEAAKAYDKVAFQMRGSNASLNFPLHYGLSPEESPQTQAKTAGRKRKQDTTVTLVKTSPKHNGSPINAVKLHDAFGPSAHGSLTSPRQSTPRENFKWTDQWLCTMCDILNKHIADNGRNCPFNWADHQLELENICHHKFKTVLALRSKYDAMRVRHNLWKSLTNGESGLRRNEITGKLDCSDDWWEKKFKVNPDFKRIRRNQPSRELQEAWDLLFDNVVPSAVDCVDLNKSNQVHHVNLEEKDDVSSERTLNSSQVGNLETQEVTSFSNFVNGVRREEGPAPNQGDRCTPSEKIVKTSPEPKSTQMECKTTESERATMLKEFMTRQNATQQSALKMHVNQVGDCSISASIGVINRMVEKGLMTACSELWCFAVNLFEDSVKRELFMSLPDDVGRLAWLQYKHNLGN